MADAWVLKGKCAHIRRILVDAAVGQLHLAAGDIEAAALPEA